MSFFKDLENPMQHSRSAECRAICDACVLHFQVLMLPEGLHQKN